MLIIIREFIAHHLVLIVPFVAAATAQIIKISIKQKKQKLKIRDFFVFTYAGMPSGHSALMVSLTTITGLTEGLFSPLFAISFVIAIVIINDALRLRNYLSQHGEVLNILVKDLGNDNVLDRKYPHLLEKIGHTKKEVLAGSALGIFVSLLAYVLFY
ncbi:MAG: divergent PAP2 family protein [Candidatus Falkowbacteria bacterium]